MMKQVTPIFICPNLHKIAVFAAHVDKWFKKLTTNSGYGEVEEVDEDQTKYLVMSGSETRSVRRWILHPKFYFNDLQKRKKLEEEISRSRFDVALLQLYQNENDQKNPIYVSKEFTEEEYLMFDEKIAESRKDSNSFACIEENESDLRGQLFFFPAENSSNNSMVKCVVVGHNPQK